MTHSPAPHPGAAYPPASGALENCRLFAARHRDEAWAKTILRLCAQGGAAGSPLRDAVPSDQPPSPSRPAAPHDALERVLGLLGGLHPGLTAEDPDAAAQAIFDHVMSERSELQRQAQEARSMLERFHADRVAGPNPLARNR